MKNISRIKLGMYAVALGAVLMGCSSNAAKESGFQSPVTEDVRADDNNVDADGLIAENTIPDEKGLSNEEDIKTDTLNDAPVTAAYVFKCIDKDGSPVAGVTLQICTEETCFLAKSDENGIIEYAAEPYEYEIHVYRYDDGYTLVSEPEFTTADEYETYEVLFES